jgi:solute carrier family 45 protein 1/2/4
LQFKFKDGKYVKCTQNRGLGGDIAIMGSMLFLAQLVLSLCMGPFIQCLGSMVAIVVSASFFAFMAALTATQVVYMDL